MDNLLNKIKWEIIINVKVEQELRSQCEEKLFENEKEGLIKDGIEVCWWNSDQNIGIFGEMGEENILNDRYFEKFI